MIVQKNQAICFNLMSCMKYSTPFVADYDDALYILYICLLGNNNCWILLFCPFERYFDQASMITALYILIAESCIMVFSMLFFPLCLCLLEVCCFLLLRDAYILRFAFVPFVSCSVLYVLFPWFRFVDHIFIIVDGAKPALSDP